MIQIFTVLVMLSVIVIAVTSIFAFGTFISNRGIKSRLTEAEGDNNVQETA